jgi:hypothetical protein
MIRKRLHTTLLLRPIERLTMVKHIMKAIVLLFIFPGSYIAQGQSPINYAHALLELQSMLQGKPPISFEKAVLLTEQTYFGDAFDPQEWGQSLDELEALCRANAKKRVLMYEGKEKDQISLYAAIFSVMTGTLDILTNEGMAQNFPFLYDFTNIWGHRDWSQMFVSKLLSTGTGQRHSLPLLYKILADECGLPSYLAFSPAHSYIRYQDERGQWNNFELTNGHLVSDSWILASGYIQSEALRSGIYMDTLREKGTISYCIVDLAIGYGVKYGMDAFVAECTDLALKHDPNGLQGWLIRSDYQTVLTQYVVKQVGNVTETTLSKRYPQAHAQVQKFQSIYAQIDRMGYKPMPKEDHQAWLQSGKKP